MKFGLQFKVFHIDLLYLIFQILFLSLNNCITKFNDSMQEQLLNNDWASYHTFDLQMSLLFIELHYFTFIHHYKNHASYTDRQKTICWY